MADLADVMDMLSTIAVGAVYPNGAVQPSVSGKPIDVAQGWPMADDLDTAMAAGRTLVTIFAVPGTTSDPGQILDAGSTVQAPVHLLTASQGDDDGVIVFGGSPVAGEYATVIIDGVSAYSYVAQPGDTPQGVAAALSVLIAADFPGASWAQDGSLTIPGTHSVAVRLGALGKLGKIIHRQGQQFRISIWAPNPADRTAVAAPIDVVLKRSVRMQMPDTSFAMIRYQSTSIDDNREKVGIYRRDLVYAVQYDTIDVFDAYEVTAVVFGSNIRSNFAA